MLTIGRFLVLLAGLKSVLFVPDFPFSAYRVPPHRSEKGKQDFTRLSTSLRIRQWSYRGL